MEGNSQVSRLFAIPTVFEGIEYRSRLEAKWASFFRKIGWDFTYEPFDGNGYIPDFVVHGESPFVVEVKPAVTWDQYEDPLSKIKKGLLGLWDKDILIVGINPFPGFDTVQAGYPTAGLLGEPNGPNLGLCKECDSGGLCSPEHVSNWWFERAPWDICQDCGRISITHMMGSYCHRPCGYYDGGHWGDPVETFTLGRYWAEATNDVKWKGTSR